jgi:protein-disulfide isomerase
VKIISKLVVFAGAAVLAFSTYAQQPAAGGGPSPLQKSVESFLRNYYALGSDVTIVVGTARPVGSSGLSELSIDVKSADGSDTVKMFVTNDGRYLIRGEVSDLTSDPNAENRSKLKLSGSPVLGDPSAPITVVEFADFECPVCRNLHDALRGILPNYPQVRLIFKSFPIDQIHPWARTAAIASRCAYQQDPKAFWKLYDMIYDGQDLISATNVYEKMQDFAAKANLNADAFKGCMAGPDAPAAVNADMENGKLLDVRSTPTLFVNGRRLVGADPHAVQQYIDYDLAQVKAGKK